VEPLRALRDQLVQRWFDADRKALALVGGGRKEGRSFIAANLAVVFAQLGARTLLVDADMRNASQHRLFGLDNRTGLSALLSERCGAEAAQRIPGLNHLSVLPAGVRPPNPSELLGRPLFAHCFHELKRDFDVILFDTAAATESGDAQAVSIRVGAALIVARKNSTRMWQVRALAYSSSQVSVTVIGAVLNEF
jgi:receptor protein-tyrosine kinase